MAKAPYKPRPAGSLKEATQALLTAAGGTVKASEITGRGQSVLQRYGDPAEPGRTMPVQIALQLEKTCGQPIVTRYLAAEAGCLLLDLGAVAAGRLGAELARVGQEASDVFAAAAAAVEDDGKVDAGEAGRIVEELDDLLRAAMTYRQHLAAIRDGEEG